MSAELAIQELRKDMRVLTEIVHWLVFFAVILHLFSCIFLGQSHMPEVF